MFNVLSSLEAWLTYLRETRYRGLVLLHSATIAQTVSTIARRLKDFYSRVVCIAPRDMRRYISNCDTLLSPSAIEKLLGTDNEAVIIATPKLLRPNLVAAAAETIISSGILVLVAPPLDDWNPGGTMSIGLYKRYLIESLYTMRSLFWADIDRDTIFIERLPNKAPGSVQERSYEPKSHVHRELLDLALTQDQAIGLDMLVHHFRSKRGRGAFIVGDRGRGKSGLLGLFAAYLIASHMVGFLPITAPSPWNVQSFFRVLARALDTIRVRRYRIIRRGDIIIGISGPWFHVRYHTPDRVEPGSFTIVDEGAALGPLRLRLIAYRAPRIAIATTIHGYEGSGRILSKIVENIVPAPRITIELQTPVRYPPGDPLEEWVYDTFMLRIDVEQRPIEVDMSKIRITEVDRARLVSNRKELRKLYSILVLAHYRNEPDDLALILDAPHHKLYAAYMGDEAVAVADVSIESGSSPYEARIIPDLLASSNPDALGLKGFRIVRIAVHPSMQRRGIGSYLLRYIEDGARKQGLDWVGASFGRPDVIRFWLKNGYSIAYVSPLPSKATGEHNIAVVKPVGNHAESIITGIAKDMLRKLLLAGHTLYRGVPVETMAYILEGAPRLSQKILGELTKEQIYRLKRAIQGSLDIESILDSYWLLLVNTILCRGGLYDIDYDERLPIIARLIQGKSLGDIVAITGKAGNEIRDLLLRKLKALYEVAEKECNLVSKTI
ncbi:tRNA(Met) cytidine acetyltransferase TmcA [Pyrofollis japonicus]|uniref:GNAT family N-acetyltransferase n=1 Tax=Pyrofollis japonicus TaxID=3060460 RepID=UPI00295B84FB|nr:GNAT family N-acetyltransferase [Pyrofollis japonicus]BEP17133.1 tRNA(Met) cytidine acetyltransferase TmcA [Pyrofollis japonicus]